MGKLTALIAELRAALAGGGGLRARALSGTVWTLVGFGGTKALQLVSNLILTRLLAPEAFGLMALALIVTAMLELMSDIGLGPSVVRSKRAEDPVFLGTVYVLQIIRGAVLCLAAVAIAGPFADLYDQPELGPLVAVLALAPLVRAFSSPGVLMATRRLDVRRNVILAFGVRLGLTLVTIGAALATGSVWALVYGTVGGAMLHVILSWLYLPRPPMRLGVERAAVREIVSFGKWVFLSTLLVFFTREGVQAIQGLMVPIATLGFIAIASMLAGVFGQLLMSFRQAVGFPSLAEVARERPERLRPILHKLKLVIEPASTAALILLSLLADPLVALLYDDRYLEAGPILSLVALAVAMTNLSMIYQSVSLAVGDSRGHAMVTAVSAFGRCGLLWLGFQYGGLPWMLAGVAAGAFLAFVAAAALNLRAGRVFWTLDLANVAAILAALVWTLS